MTQPPPTEEPGWAPPGAPSEPAPEAQPHPDPQPYLGPRPQAAPGAFPPQPVAAPYLPAQYHKPKFNGFSIAALVLGIIGGIGLSIIFGIAALVQIRRRGGRGKAMAIIGMALSLVWLALIIGVAAIGAAFTPDRDDSGHVTQKGRALLADLKVGDCFNGVPHDKTARSTTALPCAQPHDGEVLASFNLPKGGFPGQQEVIRSAESGCYARVGGRLDASRYRTSVNPYLLYPTRASWALGDRVVQCLGASTGAKLTGSLDLSPAEPGMKSWNALKPGDCLIQKDGEGESTAVKTVPCSKRHNAQLVLTFDLPAGDWPGSATVRRQSEKGCQTRLRSYFDKHPVKVDVGYVHADPIQDEWKMGSRNVKCFAAPMKGELTRSVMP
ncbi:septum formation family protein [Actinomadura barringtoniae]|uniref:Septum formation family protein n=1 Tax=Actinomadura barringtoniae TaxID=1427535 RepID=A0A939P9Q0_9ACTN|nr:DUF4190 domain-containing protein [Actinomadura barringtoniae]MBO2448485.1 septum formation family protein [Actinomadura barringtoniae]